MKKIIYLAGWAHPAISMKPLAEEVGKLLPDTTFELFSVDQLCTTDLIADGANNFAKLIAEKNGAVVVGWSLGGMISLEAAALQEGQLEKLILLSTTYSFVESEDAPFAAPVKGVEALKGLIASDVASSLNEFCRRCLSPDADDRFLTNLLSEIIRIKPEQLLLGLDYLKHKNLYPVAKYLNLPTLVVHGKSDLIITVEAARALSKLIQNVELFELKGGHYIVLTQAKVIAQKIAEFLKK